MSKKLLSTLIASLFAAAPALGAEPDDPMRCAGHGHDRRHPHQLQRAATPSKLDQYQDLGNGVLSNVGVQGRNSTTWFQAYGENFGRSDQYMFPAQRHVRRVQGGAPTRTGSRTPSRRTASRPSTAAASCRILAGDLPRSRTLGNWNNFDLGYERNDIGGYGEWQKNTPGTSASTATRSRRRAPGSAGRPTARARATATSTSRSRSEYKTSNVAFEGGYTSKTTTFTAS